ncbi:acetyl-CoA hydrolase/transferase family protein [Ramlibacter sp.]|uniref:acetyl-CoA hydrolase/transferase family protein n=1 Tax=Ramlibacter sp. TaxID=1917967 RepID=UPI003D11D1A8
MPTQVQTAREAIAAIKPGDKVVVAGCSGVPAELLRAIMEKSEELPGVTLYSGMLCGPGNYGFIAPPYDERLRYVTWHMPTAFMKGVAGARVEFLPISWGRIHRFVQDLQPDVALVSLSPEEAGEYSLGVSVGYHRSAIRFAKTVIAEVNDRMPLSFGDSRVAPSDVDTIVKTSRTLDPFDQPTTHDPVLATIGDIVAELIPDGSPLQIGVGGIPSAVLTGLKRLGRQVTLHSIITDEGVDLALAGGTCPLVPGGPTIVAVETLGTQKCFDYIARNERVHMVPSTRMQNPMELGKLRGFCSINSCLEIDLLGQCGSEMLGGKQISGIGGSTDFMEGSWLSEGGFNVVALPSTTNKGHSRIVPMLAGGTAVTLPRHAVHTVVTEYGIARLFNLSDRDRRDALISIAHPDHRAALRRGQL